MRLASLSILYMGSLRKNDKNKIRNSVYYLDLVVRFVLILSLAMPYISITRTQIVL